MLAIQKEQEATPKDETRKTIEQNHILQDHTRQLLWNGTGHGSEVGKAEEVQKPTPVLCKVLRFFTQEHGSLKPVFRMRTILIAR